MFNDPTAPLHHASTTEGVARLQHARAYVPKHASKLNLLLAIKHIHFTLTNTRRRQALLRRPIGTPLPPITRPRHNALRSDTLRTFSKIDGLHMRVFYNVNKGVHIARAQGAAPSMAAKLVTRCASELRTDRHVPNRPNTSNFPTCLSGGNINPRSKPICNPAMKILKSDVGVALPPRRWEIVSYLALKLPRFTFSISDTYI